MPKRIQRKSTKGWRMPEGAVSVTRPGKLGNPYTVKKDSGAWVVTDSRNDETHGHHMFKPEAAAQAVRLFVVYLMNWHDDARLNNSAELAIIKNELRGRDVICWCKLSDVCHGDVWLHEANK